MLTHRIILSELYLDPLTQGGEHLSEDDLLVPDWAVGVLLHAGPALQHHQLIIQQPLQHH